MFYPAMRYRYNFPIHLLGQHEVRNIILFSVYETSKNLIFERNNTLYQSVILNKKRIFVKSDRRNGWIIIESVFCFYPATEIANFITEG